VSLLPDTPTANTSTSHRYPPRPHAYVLQRSIFRYSEGLTQRALHTFNNHTGEADYDNDNKDDEAQLGLPAPAAYTMARVYADVNQQMPRAYWDYDSVNISWGVLENYEVVRKIGMLQTRSMMG